MALSPTILGKHRRVAIDSDIFIYYLGNDRRYAKQVAPLFERLEHGSLTAVTSAITLSEILVHPLRQRRPTAAADYLALLTDNPNLSFVAVDERIATEAAELRARFRFGTPDAIQLATAKLHDATLFITNDQKLRRADVPVVTLK